MNDEGKQGTLQKPRLYLDQNIYDAIRKGEFPGSLEKMTEEFEIVYSNDTIKEIEANKSDEIRNQYLDLFRKLNPTFLQLVLTEKFRITDKATFHRSPFEDVYTSWRKNEEETSNVPTAMGRLANKLIGGLPGVSILEIVEEQKTENWKMFQKTIEQFEGTNEEKIYLESQLNKYKVISKQFCRKWVES